MRKTHQQGNAAAIPDGATHQRSSLSTTNREKQKQHKAEMKIPITAITPPPTGRKT
jgi:hypothetical protein